MRRPAEAERLYLDFDGFFASVEQAADKSLRGRPIGVVPFAAAANPRAHSCVIACSREAKLLGVKNVMAISDAIAACPDLVLVPQKPDLYRRAHNTLISEISTVIPIDAVKSIDELTCRLEPSQRKDPLALGRKIKERLLKFVGPHITSSIGYAANRQLAKMACKAGKRVDGGYGDGNRLWHPDEMPGPLIKLPLSDVPGIGSRMEMRLAQAGITSMEKLLAMQPKHMRKMWRSVNGERLWYALHGYDIQTPPSERGMYGHGRVLPPESRSFNAAKDASRLLLTKAARRMRRDGWNAGCVLAFLSTGEGSFFQRAWIPAARDDKIIMAALATIWSAWRKELSPRVWIITVSVTLADITRATERQLDILLNDDKERRKAEAATEAMDKLNSKYGKNSREPRPVDASAGRLRGRKNLLYPHPPHRGFLVMNWKKELKVSDLSPDDLLEVICKKCGNGRYLTQSQLLAMPGMRHAYIDEVEKAVECHLRFCKGPVRVSLIHDGKTEGFVGGMA